MAQEESSPPALATSSHVSPGGSGPLVPQLLTAPGFCQAYNTRIQRCLLRGGLLLDYIVVRGRHSALSSPCVSHLTYDILLVCARRACVYSGTPTRTLLAMGFNNCLSRKGVLFSMRTYIYVLKRIAIHVFA